MKLKRSKQPPSDVVFPDGWGKMPPLPKLPPLLAEIFSKPIDPSETLPDDIEATNP